MRQFDATHNALQELPAQFGTLQNLEQLYLRHNHLSAIPVLKDCVSLKVLNNLYKAYSIPAKFHDFRVMLTNLKDSHDLTIVF